MHIRVKMTIGPKSGHLLREHPFNLKGLGGLWFFGEKNSVWKFDWKKNSVPEMGRKKYDNL